MKKIFLKFMALLVVALPMAILSSCDDDDDNVKTEKNYYVSEANAVEYLKHLWLNYDKKGNVEGVAIGTILYEAEPTVAYVGVENLREAQFHFGITAVPHFAAIEEYEDGNMEAILNDSTCKEINRIKFTVVNDGKVLAKAKLEKNIGMERYLTEIRYIDQKHWPENAIGNNLPFRTGCMYKYNGNTYTCVSTPSYGRDGLLVRDKNNFQFWSTLTHWGTEEVVANYPNVNTMLQISKELNSTVSGARLWQQLCATAGQTNLKDFKTREYWTSTTHDNEILTINLVTAKNYYLHGKKILWPWDDPEDVNRQGSRWEIEAYKFYISEGIVKMKICNEGIWMDKVEHPYPNVSEWTRDTNMEQKAEAIKLQ